MSSPPFRRFAWVTLVVNLGVVLWGAYVRATGSGAGCGAHWPLCNGVVIPRNPRVETLIELSHRLSSGVSLVLVVALAVWAFRAHPKGAPVRTGAAASVILIFSEAAIGAGLVLLQLVAQNKSVVRAAAGSLHLGNTFLLLAALGLTVFWSHGGSWLETRHTRAAWLLGFGALAMLLLGVSGAINALGDTLFPVVSLKAGLAQDLDPGTSFFLHLRTLHPPLAVLTSSYLLFAGFAAARVTGRRQVRRATFGLAVLIGLQLTAGVLNVVLLAPLGIQLLHLLLADLTWLAYVGVAAFALEAREEPAPAAAASPALGLG